MGWVKIYDTRSNQQTPAAYSILAHPAPRPRKIKGTTILHDIHHYHHTVFKWHILSKILYNLMLLFCSIVIIMIGIRPDPFNLNLFATFSDFPGDAIKIWDLRKATATTTTNNVTTNTTSKSNQVHPLSTINPKTSFSTEVSLKNVSCLSQLKGTNFYSMDDDYVLLLCVHIVIILSI